ncbi:MAG TPA: hypothetical protein VE398_16685 [Acidobacteriota bacterium]|nr:hypothetical protein [Acidobacteriota bacterium]
MIVGLAVLSVLAYLAPISTRPGRQSDIWAEASKKIQRLQPDAFLNLPPGIVSELKKRRCTVPQAEGYREPHNVIKGSFERNGQTDWAVLCSDGGISRILVFWDASAARIAELEISADREWLQSGADGRIEYSRKIEPVGQPYIIQHYEAYGGEKPPPIDHQGINNIFVDKASVVLYYYQGKWMKLTGAD